MEARSSTALALIRASHAAGSTAHRKAGHTVKSYFLQEAEATARQAKIDWCKSHGLKVMSLQHDGILATLPDDWGNTHSLTAEDIAEQLSGAAGLAGGYEVLVTSKEL